ncbi:MAG TPA: hypothetical protein VHJ17_24380, partial [Thermomonospora sp.]|nr:hypothetical protein [Thermomonospora sp.]
MSGRPTPDPADHPTDTHPTDARPADDAAGDEGLARAVAAGDVAALALVADRHAPRLYDYCHALLRDGDTAAAALRDTLLAAWAHAGGLADPG